ncbi:5-oxoprolinase subunit B family protein [Leifsonia poae]|uniref:Carboxyltransferase domain-containing protein n=1 Tax=Leifsonia poae TaxID=110933 RepID=A0A9W6H759_9MICO|nr:allophanate hydrolase subunit 1 [Leifsonia poae]GLJ75184.1 hypothetical protein GCM10017584_07580 [Leifsonia poae]
MAPARRILPNGDHTLLVELDSLTAVLDLYSELERTRPPGVVDLVPAARTIGVSVDPAVLPVSVAHGWLSAAEQGEASHGDSVETVELPVRYDGDDLPAVAELLGVSVAEVVARHTRTLWRVAFCGFAPGFAYLVVDQGSAGADHGGLVVPRRATPRTSVPAGSVALAGEFSGVYPRSSPGGWQLIGTTDAVLWNEDARPPQSPALLNPGTVVRFRESS